MAAGIKKQSGLHYKLISGNIYQDPHIMEIRKSQKEYLIVIIRSAGVERMRKLPSRSNLLERKMRSLPRWIANVLVPSGTSSRRSHERGARPLTSPSRVSCGRNRAPYSQQDWSDLFHLLGYVKRVPERGPEREIKFQSKDLQRRGYAEAKFDLDLDGHLLNASEGGRIKMVVRSSTEAEISAVSEIVSALLWPRDGPEESWRTIIHVSRCCRRSLGPSTLIKAC